MPGLALLLFVLLTESDAVGLKPGRDDALGAGLQDALAEATSPYQLRRHVHEAVAAAEPDLHASVKRCDLALAKWIDGLVSRKLWALQMVDASSKLITGLLFGNLADLGNFDECIAVASERNPGDSLMDVLHADSFTGLYALPTFDIQFAAQAMRFTSTSNFTHLISQARALNPTTYSTKLSVRIALCVPSTCGAPVLQSALNAALEVSDGPLQNAGVRIRARIGERDTALATSWRSMDTADFSIIALCATLALFVVIGTAVDIVLDKKASRARDRAAPILAFSAWTNGKRLLTPTPPSDRNFTCINGIRFVSALWVILRHRYRYALEVPFTNLVVVPKRVESLPNMVVAGSPLAVDTFFAVGGMVNCYAFMRAVQVNCSYNWLRYYTHRYIRLTPAFAVMVGVTATWLNLLGSGPLWAQVAGGEANSCREFWWSSLLYVANYVNPDSQCMIQSWYLMVDMQLHWLSPLLLIPLWKWRRFGVAWAVMVVVASCAVPFAVTYVNGFRTPIPSDFRPEAQAFFLRAMYFPTHTRFTSYVCGTVSGYILYKIKTNQLGTWKLSSGQVIFGWLLSLGLMATALFGAQPLFDVEHHPYNVWESSFYMGLHRAAWAIGLSWVVIACIMGCGGPIDVMLSWTPFNILGRLTYCMYLTHAAVQTVDVGLMRTSEYYANFRMVEKSLSDTILAIVFGAILCLSAEAPMATIEQVLLKPRIAATKSQSDVRPNEDYHKRMPVDTADAPTAAV